MKNLIFEIFDFFLYFENIFQGTFHNTKKIIFSKIKFIIFLNIVENIFYMVKRELPADKDTIFYLYVT